MKFVIEYTSNNSGGNWWLKDEDWKKLEENGWNAKWIKDESNEFYSGDRFLGALATKAFFTTEVNSSEEALNFAVDSFEKITMEDASAKGCSCCGVPHCFYVIEE